MQIAIIQFPGSNCERETVLAVKRAGMEPHEFLWNESPDKLRKMAGFVIVGGFSYEDRARAGIIAALDPIMEILKEQSELGKPILGICNGAQILVEAGLVPGLENYKIGMALTENKRVLEGKILGTGYYNAFVHLRLSDSYQRNAFTHRLTATDILRIPVAHAEGRFMMTEALWQEINQQGLHVFQYCDASGKILEDFPINPNGSMHNIAAISNKAGNVLAMMPHPERVEAGDVIFKSMRDYIKEGRKVETLPLSYYPRFKKPTTYVANPHSHQCLIELLITDNEAETVQQTLRQLGLPITVKRFIHWEIACESASVLKEIKKTGTLYNTRKEMEVSTPSLNSQSAAFLVRAKEEMAAKEMQQALKDHYGIKAIETMHRGVLWHFSTEANIALYTDAILNTHIIGNPYSHDCYQYC